MPAGTGLRARLAGAATAERERMVREHVRAEASRIMDTGAAQIETAAPLADEGFDSLMALELRNSLGTAAALDLPASFVFDFPTIDAITARLLALMFPDASAARPSAAADAGHLDSLIRDLDGLSDREAEAQLEEYARSLLRSP